MSEPKRLDLGGDADLDAMLERLFGPPKDRTPWSPAKMQATDERLRHALEEVERCIDGQLAEVAELTAKLQRNRDIAAGLRNAWHEARRDQRAKR